MASMDLSAFLFSNVEKAENAKIVVSKRFKDEAGKPIEWEVRQLTAGEDENLRKAATKRVPIQGRKNVFQKELDTDLYAASIAAACTVYPNLNDAALQSSYGVMGAENLLKVMLTPGEYTAYLGKVQEVNDFGDFAEDVDDAKN